MIPLMGQARLAGEWPPAANAFLMEVADAGDGLGLSLDCFYGADSPFPVAGSIETSTGPLAGPLAVTFSAALGHLSKGDIVAVNPKNGRVRVLYRRNSQHNSFLVTERCDNYCVMCSQPPRDVRDDALVDEILAAIPRLPKDVIEIGFTGGEPTLVGARFIEVLRACRAHLPSTAVHVLSNGRRFADATYAEAWAGVAHPDLLAGIPVYSDQSDIHDYVVQADGAFDETIRGILNLKRLRQRVEVRVVMHRHTIDRLPKLATFIARNLAFVDHVALMGLELMGFAIAHQEDLWIKLADHGPAIAEAATVLSRAGIRASIYNTPLCLLPAEARRFAVRSISDWKREYWEACARCGLKRECGGAFFSSRRRLESEISPVDIADRGV